MNMMMNKKITMNIIINRGDVAHSDDDDDVDDDGCTDGDVFYCDQV